MTQDEFYAYADPIAEHKGNQLIGRAILAIAADLQFGSVISLDVIKQMEEICSKDEDKDAPWLKKATSFALDQLRAFFTGVIAGGLPELLEAIEKKKPLSEDVVKQITDAAEAWHALSRMGD